MTKEQLRMQMLAGIITEGQYKKEVEEIDSMGKVGKQYAAPGSSSTSSEYEPEQPTLTPKQKEKYQDSLIKLFYNDLDDEDEGGPYEAVYNLSYNSQLILANLLSGYKSLNDDWWGTGDWYSKNTNPKHPYNILKSKGYDFEEVKDFMNSMLNAFKRNSTNNPKIKDIQSYIKASSD